MHISEHSRLNQMRQVDVFHGVIMALFAFRYAFTNGHASENDT